MNYVAQVFLSFIATVGFGIIFNVPRKELVRCGISGVVSWLVYYSLYSHHMSMVVSTGFAAFAVAIFSQIMAIKYRQPVIIYIACGIIPLVPGGVAYNAMRSFVENDYLLAISYTTNTAMLSGAIALGIVFAEVVNEVIRNRFWIKMKKLGHRI